MGSGHGLPEVSSLITKQMHKGKPVGFLSRSIHDRLKSIEELSQIVVERRDDDSNWRFLSPFQPLFNCSKLCATKTQARNQASEKERDEICKPIQTGVKCNQQISKVAPSAAVRLFF